MKEHTEEDPTQRERQLLERCRQYEQQLQAQANQLAEFKAVVEAQREESERLTDTSAHLLRSHVNNDRRSDQLLHRHLICCSFSFGEMNRRVHVGAAMFRQTHVVGCIPVPGVRFCCGHYLQVKGFRGWPVDGVFIK